MELWWAVDDLKLCKYKIVPTTSPTFPLAGGTGSVNIVTGPSCKWSATSVVPWATLGATTGGMGLHVIVPLEPRYDYEIAKGVSELVARRIHSVLPKDATLERTIAKRPDDVVYLDWVQVGKGKTYVAPFTVRARDGAPVSMPLAWRDVEAMRRKRAPETTAEMRRWTIANVPGLVAKHGDPWRREGWKPQSLESALTKARSLWE